MTRECTDVLVSMLSIILYDSGYMSGVQNKLRTNQIKYIDI